MIETLTYSIVAAALWALGGLLLYLAGWILSRRTLRALERCEAGLMPSIGRLRRIYRLVLLGASLYFYLSIPFVMLSLLGVVVGLVYVSLWLGHLQLELLLVVLLAVGLTLAAIVKGLFQSSDAGEPGERLAEQSAPELFALVREVATELEAPMVDRLFVVPDVTLAVFERGPFAKRERCLQLGLAALDGMNVSELKSILAHELGHLSNRDTAGGELALRVNRSLEDIALNMARVGTAQWYNPAWVLLGWVQSYYSRISMGASRLQEVLADRSAAARYGKAALISGLLHVTRRALELREPPPTDSEIDDLLECTLRRPLSPFDSHPPMAKRIRYVASLRGVPEPELDQRDVRTLFASGNPFVI